MKTPWVIAMTFGVCLAAVLGAMAYVTVVAIELDRREASMQRGAELQESARLALWRMDSALTPMIARENARPYYEYQPLYNPRFVSDWRFNANDQVLLPSPLLNYTPPFVKLHFQIDALGRFTCPQVPPDEAPKNLRDQLGDPAVQLACRTNLDWIESRFEPGDLRAAAPAPSPEMNLAVVLNTVDNWSEDLKRQVGAPQLADASPAQKDYVESLQREQNRRVYGQSDAPAAEEVYQSRAVGRGRVEPDQQEFRNANEYALRQKLTAQAAASLNPGNQRKLPTWANGEAAAHAAGVNAENDLSASAANGGSRNVEGLLKPIWYHGELLLVRQVERAGETIVQGVWLDWPAIQDWLQAEVRDLLPEAHLVPATGAGGDGSAARGERLLASMPVKLDPGTLPGAMDTLSPSTRNALMVSWAATLVACAAVGLLLWGTVSLSERRADFVSAVTHELRTPLTTFRMYTQMLTDGRVSDEQKQQGYLATLRRESDRLGHLVENVLSFARLEKGRSVQRGSMITVDRLLERVRGRLGDRATQAGMELIIEADDAAREAELGADEGAVEQILFNLCDNACKYAARGDDRRLHLSVEAEAGAGAVVFAMRDHGPGLSRDVKRRLFKPFSKSAEAAARSAPGVGLGLALCRRLARGMGGVLTHECADGGGCRFVLRVPRG